MKNRGQKVHPGTGNLNSATVDQIFAAFDTTASTSNCGPSLEPSLVNNFKLISKKDPQTRSKSLTDLLVDIRSRLESSNLIEVIPLFMESYIRGALLDPNWKCRSLYHRCLVEIFNKVGGRALESTLPRIIPILMLSQYDDTNPEIAHSSITLFHTMFPSPEKQLRVIDHFKSNVTEYLEHNLAASPKSLSKQFRPTLSGESTPDDEFESIERYERVIRCCIKCISTHFPNFQSTSIIGLLTPTTSPIIQSDVIKYLSQSESLIGKIPDPQIYFLVSEVALVSSSPVFFQESVWSLINVLPKNVFDQNPLFSKLVNFLKLTDCRSWNSVMMNTLPRLVKKKSETVDIVFQKIQESMVLRNSKLFHTLCCFILRLDSNTAERLISLVFTTDNAMKYALATAFGTENISFDSVTHDDPVLELLLSHYSKEKPVIELVHSLSSISDLKFVIDKYQDDEILFSISSHPKLLSPEWINDKHKYIALIDSMLTSGWKYLGDFYNSSIAPELPFEYIVELVTNASGEWVSHALAPEIKDPDQFAATILESEELGEVFKTAIEFSYQRLEEKTTTKTTTTTTTIRNNGIVHIGRYDFNRVIEQLVIFGNMTEYLLEQNAISCSVGLAVFQRVCSDQNTRVTKELCTLVKQLVSVSDLDAVIASWSSAAYINGDDRFENVLVEDLTDCHEIGRKKMMEFLVSHKFEVKKFPKIDIFKTNYELLAIWIIRKIDTIDSQETWDEFELDLEKVVDVENWSLTMNELVRLIGFADNVSWRVILDSITLVAKRIPSMSLDWVESILGKIEVPVAVRLCALILADLEFKEIDFKSLKSEDEFSKMIFQIVSGEFQDENFMRFLSLGSEAGLRRHAEKLLAKSFPNKSEFLDVFYQLDDEHVAQFFARLGGVGACEDAASRYVSIVGTPWRIHSEIVTFLSEHSSLEWAIGTLLTPLNRLGQARILKDSVQVFELISIPQFRSTLKILLQTNSGCVLKLMNSLVEKFVTTSESNDFVSLFELSESLGGDETGQLRDIFMHLLHELAEDIMEEGVTKRTGVTTPPLTEMAIPHMFLSWSKCVSPGEFHDWVSRGGAPPNFADTLAKSGLSSHLIEQALHKKYMNPSLKQSYSKSSKLLVCRYTTCGGEITAELTVAFPDTWPARLATIEVSAVAGLSRAKNSRLKISIQQVFRTNGVQQAVQIWIENIEGFLANVEECYICYSVTYHHGTKGTGSGTGSGGAIPDKECRNCHYKFHAQCLLKWFKQSQKTNCVLCQQPF